MQSRARGLPEHDRSLEGLDPLVPRACRSWVLLRLKDRWVQRLLDQRAKSGPSSRALSREVDQVLLPLSSVISWVTVVVSAAAPPAGVLWSRLAHSGWMPVSVRA